MRASSRIQKYYSLIQAGEWEALFEKAAENFTIDSPTFGCFSGKEALTPLFEQQREILKKYRARIEPQATTVMDNTTAAEFLLHFTVNGKPVEVPSLLIAEIVSDTIEVIRIYHSTFSLSGQRKLRPPLLPPAKYLSEPKIIEQYMKALRAGDLEALLEQFEEDAYIQEAAGATHRGAAALRKSFSKVLADGGLPIIQCAQTFDGDRCVIEYNLKQWGSKKIPPQCGCAVYEIGPFGKIAAIRIYDDIVPPEQ
ncbi:nuclear transport factor 2 family protein [bacterium]|nr:nuclear transport factor 2 family protein [bacterium]